MSRFSSYALKPPSIPIPFGKLLKVVAVVEPENGQANELLAQIRADGYEVEVTDRYERDVGEDASVGAYIVWVDGERLGRAKELASAVRGIGFRTPLWALADTHRISDLPVAGGLGEIEGDISLGQQSPTFYSKQVIASIVKYGMSRCRPSSASGGLRRQGNHCIRLPRPPGRAVLSEVATRAALLQALR